MEIPQTRGDILRQARARMDKTQKWVAAAAEVHERTVMRAEQNKDISSENLMAICSVLGLDAARLSQATYHGDEDPAELDVDPAPDGVMPVPASKRMSLTRSAVHGALMALVLLVAGAAGAWTGLPSMDETGRGITLSLDFVTASSITTRVNQLAHAMVSDGDDLASSIHRIRSTNSGFDCILPDACVQRRQENAVASLPDGSYLVTLGPLSPEAFVMLAQKVTADPRVTVQATISTTSGTPSPGHLWFDPRGVAIRNLPTFPANAFLQLRISRT